MRPYDVVLFGATGFTGGLVARQLAARATASGARWAIAGRDRAKLEALRDQLAAEEPAHGDVPIIVARSNAPDTLRRMVEQTRVIATTVGPFDQFGDPLVDACVEAGTDYVDITGEPAFWRRTIDRHHERASERGILVVPCCGFDSIPHDLGALFTAQHLPGDGALQLDGFVRASGEPSGGTWASAIHAMANLRQTKSEHRSGTKPSGPRDPGPRIHHEAAVDQWVVPFPSVDPLVVRRSARFTPEFGDGFRYHHYLQVASLPKLAKLLAGTAAVVAMAQLRPTRDLLLRWRAQGDGPSDEVRARSKFVVTFVGHRDGKSIRTEVSGRDPGYGLTAVMLAESALTLVHDRDRLPHRGGVLTPAAGLHVPLLDRLQRAGLDFRVV
ncbi:MAG: saccharopine dehydrogenase NADP-binding domain-containing protein [Myxococcales bacterium]|nr:saccharopine dehydrogenase NADP-binding domain-containing protein [Myxococcales bacterium]